MALAYQLFSLAIMSLRVNKLSMKLCSMIQMHQTRLKHRLFSCRKFVHSGDAKRLRMVLPIINQLNKSSKNLLFLDFFANVSLDLTKLTSRMLF